MKTIKPALILGTITIAMTYSLARVYSDSGVMFKSRARLTQESLAGGLPVVERVPEFSFTSTEGKQVRPEDLKGKVWSINFFFTSCPMTCPVITENMKVLQERFKDTPNFQMLSLSVDPKNDTLEALKKFAEKHELDSSKWTLIRGELPAVKKVIEEGFKLALGDDANLHSNRAILIDRDGNIRGSYLVLKPDESVRLGDDAEKLLARR